MPSVTMIRLDAVQRWPAWKNAPFTATDTAVGKIGVVEHDERILAAHLELHARAVLHRRRGHDRARRRATR